MRPFRPALAIAAVAFAALAAAGGPVVGPQRLLPTTTQQVPDAAFTPAELEQREEQQAAASSGDRGAQCAEEARLQNLQGDDYRHFMIRCMKG